MKIIIKLIGEWISVDRDIAVSKDVLFLRYRAVLKENKLSLTRKFTQGDDYALCIFS